MASGAFKAGTSSAEDSPTRLPGGATQQVLRAPSSSCPCGAWSVSDRDLAEYWEPQAAHMPPCPGCLSRRRMVLAHARLEP